MARGFLPPGSSLSRAHSSLDKRRIVEGSLVWPTRPSQGSWPGQPVSCWASAPAEAPALSYNSYYFLQLRNNASCRGGACLQQAVMAGGGCGLISALLRVPWARSCASPGCLHLGAPQLGARHFVPLHPRVASVALSWTPRAQQHPPGLLRSGCFVLSLFHPVPVQQEMWQRLMVTSFCFSPSSQNCIFCSRNSAKPEVWVDS